MIGGLRIEKYVFYIIALMVIVFSTSASAKTLNIVTIELAPFGFFTSNNQSSGMMFEISNLIAEEAGLDYRNRVVPYARSSQEVASGSADFVLRFSNEVLEQHAIQVAAVVEMKNIVIGRSGTEYKALTDLHGKRVANLQGAVFDKAFQRDQQILKYDVKDYGVGLKMMFADRGIDGVIGSHVGVFYTALKMGISPNNLGMPLELSSQNFWLHYSKATADEKTISALKSAIQRLQERGAFTEVIDKYLGDYGAIARH